MAIKGGDDTVPAGRKPFGMHSEVVRPHKYADGQDAAGTPAANVHGKASAGYNSPEGHKHRAALRGDPIRDNETVHSKATKRYGVNPTSGDVHGSTGEQPAKIRGRDLPSGIHSRDVHGPGKLVHETVGHLPGGGWANPTHPNSSQGRQGPGNIHRPGTESKPSGRTITK